MDTNTPADAPAGTPGPGHEPGRPPYGAPPPADTSTRSGSFWDAVRRTGIVRTQDRWVGGVAGGLAARVGVDPLLVRGLLAVTFLIGGAGLVLYGLAWAMLPEASDGRIHLQELGAGRSDVALLGALGFVVVGLARGGGWWWFWDGDGWFSGLVWLAALAGLGALVYTAVRRPTPPAPPTPGGPYGPFPPAGAAAAPHPSGTPAWGTAGSTGAPAATVPLPAADAPTAPLPPAPAAPPAGPPQPPYSSQPPRAPRPPRPPRNGADGATVGVVVGLSALGLAALLLAERTGLWDGSVWLTAGGIALVLAGLGIVSLGLRGRSSGFVGFLAVVGLAVWVPSALVEQVDPGSWARDRAPVSTDDRTFMSRSEASQGVSLGLGSSEIDLTSVPLDDDPLRVPVEVGAGELTIVVPAEAAVRADVTIGAGSVSWELDGTTRTQDGVGLGDLRFEDEATQNGDPAQIVLDISVGAGEVRIIEEDAA